MTIKITKPGKIEYQVYVGTCYKCKCEIQCTLADIVFPDRPCAEEYVPCPTVGCGGYISPKLDLRK